jgi:agmatinase
VSLRAPSLPFLGGPATGDPATIRTPYVFLGIPFGPPYAPEDLVVCADAADAVRASAHRMEYDTMWLSHDFDWGGPLFPDGVPTVTDCGDVIGDVRDPDRIWDDAGAVLDVLVADGRVPLVVGGLDAIPPMVVGAFEGRETVNVLHVDAHLDFRHERDGVTRGYSSPIRRIRDLACVAEVVQVGMRGAGYSGDPEVADARACGNRIITAWDVHEHGIASVVEALAASGRWIVTIDCDGLDPTVAPGVGWPEPGGLTYAQVATPIRALARAGRVAALVVTELRPALDVRGATAHVATRLFMNVIGLQRTPGAAHPAA